MPGGRLLLERGDSERAEELFDSALALAEEVGLTVLAERIRAV